MCELATFHVPFPLLAVVCFFPASANCLQVLVVGDSHVRRMAEVSEPALTNMLREVTVTFLHKGGEGVRFLWQLPTDEHFDIVVFAVGSNNLANGMTPEELFKRLNFHAKRILDAGLCRKVVMMGMWPRADSKFNKAMRVFNKFKSTDRERVVFWRWSHHLRYRILPDRTHLQKRCYRRAVKYLCSPFLYVIKYLFK